MMLRTKNHYKLCYPLKKTLGRDFRVPCITLYLFLICSTSDIIFMYLIQANSLRPPRDSNAIPRHESKRDKTHSFRPQRDSSAITRYGSKRKDAWRSRAVILLLSKLRIFLYICILDVCRVTLASCVLNFYVPISATSHCGQYFFLLRVCSHQLSVSSK